MACVAPINASSVCLHLGARTSNEHYAYAVLSCSWTIQAAHNKGCHLSQLPGVNKPERRRQHMSMCVRTLTRRKVHIFGQVPLLAFYGYGQQLMQLRANYRISRRSPQRFSL